MIGGGTAGTIAAIQAGRLGAKTILVEAGSQLGGTTTTGGVDFPGLFHAWGRQVIAGIGWDLVKQTVELNNDELDESLHRPTDPFAAKAQPAEDHARTIFSPKSNFQLDQFLRKRFL